MKKYIKSNSYLTNKILITHRAIDCLLNTLNVDLEDAAKILYNHIDEYMTPAEFADSLYKLRLYKGFPEDETAYDYILEDIENAFNEYLS